MYKPTDIAIYIHWPFCKSKCPYCDFYKEVQPNIDQSTIIDEYIRSLSRYHEITADRIVKSIFFGGGTPSLIAPKNIERILNFITRTWKTVDNVEISLEANPNSHYQTMFSDLKNAGINRLSLGVQALNNNDLRFLGRTHTLEQARLCLGEIVKTFDNHSADLIYALPHQQTADWLATLQEIISYGLKHLSVYQLTIEENTIFHRRGIQPLEEDAALTMYHDTINFLTDNGYQHYEVSNFAHPSYASVHNLTYWQGGDYIGIGKSAHGRICLDGQHIGTVYPFIHENISVQERAEELLLMGLRLTQGISLCHFEEKCGIPFYNFINNDNLQNLCQLHLLELKDGYIRATRDGMPLLNELIRQLCS